jgi:hypothetical protein
MEIEQIVTRHGATGFVSGWQENEARVMFEMRGRRLRFSVKVPPEAMFERRAGRSPATAREQHIREKWRLLLFLIRSKLEAVRSGAAIFEEEMLPYTVMPSGQTVGEWLGPQLDDHLKNNTMPPLLPG